MNETGDRYERWLKYGDKTTIYKPHKEGEFTEDHTLSNGNVAIPVCRRRREKRRKGKRGVYKSISSDYLI